MGKSPSELEPRYFPEELRYLWEWYQELRMGAGEPMTWSDIDAWSRHTGNRPEPQEVTAFFLLQFAWLEARNPKT